jgi:hypothetical protein
MMMTMIVNLELLQLKLLAKKALRKIDLMAAVIAVTLMHLRRSI